MKTKKLISVLMSLVLLVSITAGLDIFAQAAESIAYGSDCDVIFDGTADAAEQTQQFIFTVPDGGYFYYTLTPKYYVYSDGEEEPYYYDSFFLSETKLTYSGKDYEKKRNIGYGDVYTSCSYSFKKGAKVTISVTDCVGENEQSCYTLRVYFKKVKNFEKEANNTKKKATKLTAGKTFTGICVSGDTDWWVFTAPKDGKYRISAAEVNPGFSKTVRVFKGSELVNEAGIKSSKGYATCFSGKLKKGEKVYLLLRNGKNNEMYRIKVIKK